MMSGGCIRALREAMNLPMSYTTDARDYTLVSRKQAQMFAFFGVLLMAAAQGAYIRMFSGR